RLMNGLPVIDVTAEMAYYSIPDPYQRGNEYYRNHYVCPWVINEEEVVGSWEWGKLATNEDWYEEVVVPAFNKFKKEKEPGPTTACASTFNMSEVMENLPG
ncbi:hypothetical protein EJ02DRAFT_358689, partial [Clathrospora elynae]